MKLVDYLAMARERLLVVLVVIVLAVATVVALAVAQDPEHVASVRLRARPAVPGSAASTVIEAREEQTDLGTEAQLVRSTQVAEAVAEQTGYAGPADDLLDEVEVVVLPDTAVLLVSARASDAGLAVARANAFAETYLTTRRAVVTEALDQEAQRQSTRIQQLVDRLGEADAFLTGLDPDSSAADAAQSERARVLSELIAARSSLDALSDRAAVAAGFGEIIQPASGADVVRATSIPRAGVFGFLLGLPLALAVVLLLDSLSSAVRTRDDAERASGVDVLGIIPTDPGWTDPVAARLAAAVNPFSAAAEAYRVLSYALARAMTDSNSASVLVTSPGDGDGKTATVANLALTAADGGHPCHVIDADLRNSRLHAFFGVERQPGLSDVLAGEVPLTKALIPLGSGSELLAAGRRTDRPDLLLARADVGGLLNQVSLVDRGDGANGGRRRPLRAPVSPAVGEQPSAPAVFVDSAPILEAGEVSRLAATVDAVVLVARMNVTSKAALAAAAEQVHRVGGTLLGVVLVGGRPLAEPAMPSPAAPATAVPARAR